MLPVCSVFLFYSKTITVSIQKLFIKEINPIAVSAFFGVFRFYYFFCILCFYSKQSFHPCRILLVPGYPHQRGGYHPRSGSTLFHRFQFP